MIFEVPFAAITVSAVGEIRTDGGRQFLVELPGQMRSPRVTHKPAGHLGQMRSGHERINRLLQRQSHGLDGKGCAATSQFVVGLVGIGQFDQRGCQLLDRVRDPRA